ncbi:hypothetical protein F0231_06175 [Vibrio sp. RE86]|uniref:hypothetical protein n=1 Tax=Vibrio sp. RE86 TaxID=2607605 RepID=UPI001493DB80|nr:hypothetical protein [Vibrio sp. RE86]NOH79326.1 hypothetical protein [Vibrio sp. RE86]
MNIELPDKKFLKMAGIILLTSVVLIGISSAARYFIYERPKVIAKEKEIKRQELIKSSLKHEADLSVEEEIEEFCHITDMSKAESLVTYWIYGHYEQFPGWNVTNVSCFEDKCRAQLKVSSNVQDHRSAVNAIKFLLDKLNEVNTDDSKFSYSFENKFSTLNIRDFTVDSIVEELEDKSCSTSQPQSEEVLDLVNEMNGIVKLYKDQDVYLDIKPKRPISYRHENMVKFSELSHIRYVQDVDIYASSNSELYKFVNAFETVSPWHWKVKSFEYPQKSSHLRSSLGYKLSLMLIVKE